MTSRWLITGGSGMVATDLRHELEWRDVEVVSVAKNDLDVTDPEGVSAFVREAKPSVIVNCAAYTRVDEAEANEPVATAINGSAVEFLADAADAAGADAGHRNGGSRSDEAEPLPSRIARRRAFRD